MPSGVHGRGASAHAHHELAQVDRVQAVGVLVGVDREQRGLVVEMVGQRHLQDVGVDVGVAVVAVDDRVQLVLARPSPAARCGSTARRSRPSPRASAARTRGSAGRRRRGSSRARA